MKKISLPLILIGLALSVRLVHAADTQEDEINHLLTVLDEGIPQAETENVPTWAQSAVAYARSWVPAQTNRVIATELALGAMALYALNNYMLHAREKADLLAEINKEMAQLKHTYEQHAVETSARKACLEGFGPCPDEDESYQEMLLRTSAQSLWQRALEFARHLVPNQTPSVVTTEIVIGAGILGTLRAYFNAGPVGERYALIRERLSNIFTNFGPNVSDQPAIREAE